MPRKRKKDQAEQQTDDLLEELEKRIAAEYSVALKEVQEKYDRFAARFAEEDAKKIKDVKNGKITQEQYIKWRTGKIYTGQRYQDLVNVMAEDLARVDQKAMSIANGYMPEAYALNFNYTTYEVEQGTNINTAFTLYSRETVEKLVRDNAIELPKRKVDIPLDEQWNRKHINSAILQGVLQGDSIPDIAKRLQQVTDMDRKAAVRNARTMMTGAQNGGRMDAYERAAGLGIDIQKEWMATLDSRTRDSHQKMDGERVDWKKPFSNELMYPGDPEGDPAEVYNCRCTMIPFYPEFESAADKRMTYSEWAGQHEEEEKTGISKIIKVENDITRAANINGVEYLEPKLRAIPRTEEEIINDVGGGDMTTGSCASLAFCYAGNKAGYDVLDFRGGNSLKLFARANIERIANFDGVKSFTIKEGNDFKAVKELIKYIESGKEYILFTGKHAAVVKRNAEGILQYLELQSNSKNGWKNFEGDYIMYEGWAGFEKVVHRTISDTLKARFGCQKSHSVQGYKLFASNTLIEIDSLLNSDDFKSILGYINTNESEQKKGASGHEK